MLSPYWLRTVEVGFWQLHWDGVNVWMLLGNFQLCDGPRYVRNDMKRDKTKQIHHKTS